jgi:hypothetical protein
MGLGEGRHCCLLSADLPRELADVLWNVVFLGHDPEYLIVVTAQSGGLPTDLPSPMSIDREIYGTAYENVTASRKP